MEMNARVTLCALLACGEMSAIVLAAEQGAPVAATPVRIQLNWVPEPEFGGIYAAEELGLFTAAGLDVKIIAGAAGVPVPQMVASGTCEIGVVSGAQVLTTNGAGGDLVGFFATFQQNPTCVILRESMAPRTLREVWTGGFTVAVEDGLPWVAMANATFGSSNVRLVPYSGALASFEADPKLIQQAFISAEPVQLALKGVAVRAISVAESGFNPYEAVYATSRRYLDANPGAVAAFARAVQAGWVAYQADPAKFNGILAPLNPAMSLEAMNLSAKTQTPLIETDETRANGIGFMTQERWKQTQDALLTTKIMKTPTEWQRAWTWLCASAPTSAGAAK